MNSIDRALQLDLHDQPVQAADAYEEVLKHRPLSRDALVNLIGIYFASLDGGYSAHHHLTQQFIDRADKRLNELINSGATPENFDTEIDFWKRYYQARVLGEDWDEVFRGDYEAIVKRGEYLAPYLALFLSSEGKKYELELDRLLAEVGEGRTQRERELRSVAESSKRQFNQRRN